MRWTIRQTCAAVLSLSLLTSTASAAQEGALKITILEGDNAILNTRERVAREAIVQVEDENRKPVAGAALTFLSPSSGPSATFSNGLQNITLMTDEQGRAVLRGIKPNQAGGKYEIQVRAVKDGKTGSTVLSQTNALAATAAAAGISGKMIAILVAVGAAGAVGAAVGLSGGKSPAPGPAPGPGVISIGVTPGTPTVGPPR
jgi:hypothetical protein